MRGRCKRHEGYAVVLWLGFPLRSAGIQAEGVVMESVVCSEGAFGGAERDSPGRVRERKEELRQSVLLPSVPTPPSNLPDRISSRRW